MEADKQLRLLTTKVNMKDFHNDFTFLGHIYSQLGYTLSREYIYLSIGLSVCLSVC